MPEDLSEPLTDSEALNEILELTETIELDIREAYNDIEEVAAGAVDDSIGLERPANTAAVKTVVINLGDQDLRVREDGITVGIIKAGTSGALAGAGKGLILLICASGLSTTAAIATYVYNT